MENLINYPYFLQQGPHSYIYDTDSNFNHASEWIYRSAFRKRYTKLLKKRGYRDILSNKYFNLDYYDKIVDDYLYEKNYEIRHNRLNWGSDLFNLIGLTDQGWY